MKTFSCNANAIGQYFIVSLLRGEGQRVGSDNNGPRKGGPIVLRRSALGVMIIRCQYVNNPHVLQLVFKGLGGT